MSEMRKEFEAKEQRLSDKITELQNQLVMAQSLKYRELEQSLNSHKQSIISAQVLDISHLSRARNTLDEIAGNTMYNQLATG